MAGLGHPDQSYVERLMDMQPHSVLHAGFPVASPDDFDAVRRIAMDVGNSRDANGYVPVICGLSRTKLRCLPSPNLHAPLTQLLIISHACIGPPNLSFACILGRPMTVCCCAARPHRSAYELEPDKVLQESNGTFSCSSS